MAAGHHLAARGSRNAIVGDGACHGGLVSEADQVVVGVWLCISKPAAWFVALNTRKQAFWRSSTTRWVQML